MSEQQIDLSKIKRLTLDRREAAYKSVKDKIKTRIGDAPKLSNYWNASDDTTADYPSWTLAILAIISVVVLTFALVAGGLRVWQLSYDKFLEQLADPSRAIIGAHALTILAEGAMLVFMISMSMTSTAEGRKRALYLGLSVGSALISISANVTVAIPTQTPMWFDYIDAVWPSLVSIGLGYTLKEQLLTFIKSWNSASKLWRAAKKSYQATIDNPRNHADFMPLYAAAIRDELVKANQRSIPTIGQMDNAALLPYIVREIQDDWQYLISNVQTEQQTDGRTRSLNHERSQRTDGGRMNSGRAANTFTADERQTDERTAANGYTKNMTSDQAARAWYAEHPEYLSKSYTVNQITELARADGVAAGRTKLQEVRLLILSERDQSNAETQSVDVIA